ncbi:MAG TPA: DNA mismatch repair endonuclease MutL, partial [Herpetosiphonaceae bacterium]|nr:DNA mismatch repair endonuclease MutL [Herpetosiphonaceae bacterium]
MATTSGGPIQRLDEFTIAQIRAGEAIEHPAAAVKEAIENAIDAGATAIRVEIRAGGKREIRISDNGSGIPADQLELAFERHTTSKLRRADDLFAVLTLGFRGEALASMASVAQVTCISRTADAEVGVEVRLARGKVISRAPRGTPPGTTLIIQNLFGEVPVRLKFLKSDAAEAARVTEVVQHAALSRPQIRWTLLSDGREQLQTSGSGDARDVMLTLYGPEVVRDLLPVNDQDGSGELATRVSGWISRPGRTLGTRKGMHLFVNGRPIQVASALGAAVQDAYFHQLPSGRFPYTCLAIEVDPAAVDVNIHPSKRDVKLQFNDRVLGLIGRAVRTALSEDAPLMPAHADTSPPTPARAPVVDEHDEPATGSSELE